MIMKRRKRRAEETSLDNLTGASQKVGELETQALEEQFDDADGWRFLVPSRLFDA